MNPEGETSEVGSLDFTRRLNPIRDNVSWKRALLPLIIVLLVLILPAAFEIWFINASKAEDNKFRAEGVNASATVVERKTLTARRTDYVAIVRFATLRSTTAEGVAMVSVPLDLWLRLRSGDGLPIIYLRNDSDRARLNLGDVYHKGQPHAAERAASLQHFLVLAAVLIAAGAWLGFKAYSLDDAPVGRSKKPGAL